jgi:hypothetical protein
MGHPAFCGTVEAVPLTIRSSFARMNPYLRIERWGARALMDFLMDCLLNRRFFDFAALLNMRLVAISDCGEVTLLRLRRDLWR